MKSLNLKSLQEMIDSNFISVQKHPTEELFIYNYTPKAQFSHFWNNETLSCRGLIMDKDYNVKARPFRKFFNLEEIEGQGKQLPLEDFEIFDKLDGSLGILYWVNDKPYIATRGSFTSEQSQRANKILYQDYEAYFQSLNRNFTYLFEIIYPENRIVVDYGGIEDLYLLTVIETESGEEMLYDQMISAYSDMFPIVKRYDAVADYRKFIKNQKDNSEGYVIRYKNNIRVKVKFEEYKRLHRLVTGVNAKTIWELLKNHQDFNELLERVPDEFYTWVKTTRDTLEMKYADIETYAKQVYQQVKDLPTRKDQATAVFNAKKAGSVSAVVFKMIDQKPYDDIIWKQLKPRADKPFREDM